MKVLSLCDGISCGRMALEKAGIPVDVYYAAEIKSIAIEATKTNFPQTIQIGDVTKIYYKDGVLHTEVGDFEEIFDLVMFGSPCQSFSRAMKKDKRTGLEDKERSGLFVECARILKEVKPRYFFVENVIMKKEDRDFISETLGVYPIQYNSKNCTAQIRDRLYWTNIQVNILELPQKDVKLNDILRDGYSPKEKARCLMKNESHGYWNGTKWAKAIKRYYRWASTGFGTLVFQDKESYERCNKEYTRLIGDKKPSAKMFDGYEGTTFDCIRYLWKEERARCQTIPEKYVECLTEKNAADLIGDGWTVDVIAWFFKYLKE